MDELERALDDCLQQLTSGKSSLGQCLARYPKYAAELRPILETALRLQQGKELRPSGAIRNRARAKLASHMEAHPRQPRKVRVVPRLAFGIVIVALLAMAAGTGFAQAALPGDALYNLKLSSERAWRAAAPDPVSADLVLADRRATELVTLASRPAITTVDIANAANAESEGIAAYNDVLWRLATESTGPQASHILHELKSHQNRLSEVGIHVPELDSIVSHANPGDNQGQNQSP